MAKIKQTQKRINKELKSYQSNSDDNGNSVINITVYNDNDFLSPYSTNNTEFLSEETATFLEHSAKVVPPKNPLHIRIHSNEIDDNEKVKYKKAIKNYYFHQLMEIQSMLKHNSIISLVFTILSALIFILQFSLIDTIVDIPTLSELINVIGWVFMWEAVDHFVIERGKINRTKYRYLNLMEAKLTFVKLDTKNK